MNDNYNNNGTKSKTDAMLALSSAKMDDSFSSDLLRHVF